MPLVGTRRSRVDGWVVGMRPPRARPNGDDVAAPAGRCATPLGASWAGWSGVTLRSCQERAKLSTSSSSGGWSSAVSAALIGAAGLAIAQPLLDAFGKSPETFVFRDVAGTDLVLFALGIVARPPAGAVVGRTARGLASAAVACVRARRVDRACWSGWPWCSCWRGPPTRWPSWQPRLLGLGGWVLTVRAKAFQMWGQLLACLPVMALIAFLVASPASDLLVDDGFEAAAASGTAAPVVLIVLDELPTASIIDASGAIDAVRFPNLARLAAAGTWYRNHTTHVRLHQARGADDLHGPEAGGGRRAAVHRASGQPVPSPRRFARPRRVGGAHPPLSRVGVRF